MGKAMGEAMGGAKSGAACGLRGRERASAGDRAVLVGGFLVFLLTGFYGAEPTEATQYETAVSAMAVREPLRGAASTVSRVMRAAAVGSDTENAENAENAASAGSAVSGRRSVRRTNCAACR